MEDKVENTVNEELIEKFFRGDCSEEEKLIVSKIFCDNNKKEKLSKILKKQWYSLQDSDDGSVHDLHSVLYRIHYNINTDKATSKKSFRVIADWFARIAAILILPLAIYSGINFFGSDTLNINKKSWVEIKAPAWTHVRFSLPDGTDGWLNSGSSLRYKGDFLLNRKVFLKGEAFFNVFKNKKAPFRVIANQIVVTALGTEFNVASYAGENSIEVLLKEGKLLVSDNRKNNSITMNPNDFVVYDKKHESYSRNVVQPEKYISWTAGKLSFRNDPLDIIVNRLQRWYNVDVELKGDTTQDLRLRATFVDESLEDVMAILKESLPIDYRIIDHHEQTDSTYSKKKIVITFRNR